MYYFKQLIFKTVKRRKESKYAIKLSFTINYKISFIGTPYFFV